MKHCIRKKKARACTHLEVIVRKVIERRMEGKRGRGKLRIMLLDEIEANETYENIKRRTMKENIGETGCLTLNQAEADKDQ